MSPLLLVHVQGDGVVKRGHTERVLCLLELGSQASNVVGSRSKKLTLSVELCQGCIHGLQHSSWLTCGKILYKVE